MKSTKSQKKRYDLDCVLTKKELEGIYLGTLFNQQERSKTAFGMADSICAEAKRLMQDHGVSEAAAMKALELSITIHDYDTKDEQLAGFGEIARDLVGALNNIHESFNR